MRFTCITWICSTHFHDFSFWSIREIRVRHHSSGATHKLHRHLNINDQRRNRFPKAMRMNRFQIYENHLQSLDFNCLKIEKGRKNTKSVKWLRFFFVSHQKMLSRFFLLSHSPTLYLSVFQHSWGCTALSLAIHDANVFHSIIINRIMFLMRILYSR